MDVYLPPEAVPLTPEMEGYRARVMDCTARPEELDELYTLHVGPAIVGHIRPEFARRLEEFSDVFDVRSKDASVVMSRELRTPEERTKAMAGVLRELRSQGVITGWRDELYPVVEAFHQTPLMLVERAAVPYLGVRAYGVHINGYTVSEEGEVKMWVARRSKTKQTWPSKLDHIVAGGQPVGISCADNVIKECQEEASIPEPLARKAKPCGAVSYVCMQLAGLKRDVLFVYDLELPADFKPKPEDGEVEEFMLWPIPKVAEVIQTTTEFKPNCALVVIDFLIRHGYIKPDEPGYLDLFTGLRIGHCA
ncbi:unnamed protein product [Ostreobium quekettii]|uniref:Nudix hydrolase domain-containing protein n=1 Tax=Ostreobium quekettii TaxID=121088 RepID=A0A8S1IW14_9CHLO|nr:unnamed protein product [Ostreobium quekettii]|eukprot:evm.model.scf_1778.5 EVM.evm.TU.scf_1778.5   scf_1778:14119-17573(-)